MRIYKIASQRVTPVIKFKKLALSSVEVCPHCRKEILEKSTFCDKEWFVYHGPCKDKGPIEHIEAANIEDVFSKSSATTEQKREACALDGRGRSDKMGVTESDVDPEQLKRGIEVEHEHSDDDEIAKKIALDHLAEIPDYYTRLDAMEEQAKKDGKFNTPESA